jgi:hypothetical protein
MNGCYIVYQGTNRYVGFVAQLLTTLCKDNRVDAFVYWFDASEIILIQGIENTQFKRDFYLDFNRVPSKTFLQDVDRQLDVFIKRNSYEFKDSYLLPRTIHNPQNRAQPKQDADIVKKVSELWDLRDSDDPELVAQDMPVQNAPRTSRRINGMTN